MKTPEQYLNDTLINKRDWDDHDYRAGAAMVAEIQADARYAAEKNRDEAHDLLAALVRCVRFDSNGTAYDMHGDPWPLFKQARALLGNAGRAK